MLILKGKVSSRYGVAAPNLETVRDLILKRTGLAGMYPGTLNVTLPEPYIVAADVAIEKHEYKYNERIKFQRCCVRGIPMFIMRPETHELPGREGANVLELVSHLPLRSHFSLQDGDELEVEVEGSDSWWRGEKLL